MSEQDKPEASPSPQTAATNTDGTNNQSASERRDRFERHGGGRRRHSNNPSNNNPRRQDIGRTDSSPIGTSVNMDELREVVELIAQHGFTDFELEREGFRVRLRRGTANTETIVPSSPPSQPLASSFAAPAVSTPAPPSSSAASSTTSAMAATPAPDKDADLQIITSPIVGTFYRAASPTSDPFVKPGSSIEADTVVCIIEAMKLMNEIPAEISGTIEKVFVENAQPVEYGQPLFGVRK